MKHTVADKAALKAKSEDLGIPFSNLLAGYVLEMFMYLLTDCAFAEYLWLKNGSIFGVEQYRKKNVLTLEFAYLTDQMVLKKGNFAPGQKLSLKIGYVMLASILKEDKVPEIKWMGRVEEKGEIVELEVVGTFEEMKVPLLIRITELKEEEMLPVRRELSLFMEQNTKITYLNYPAEAVVAEQLYLIIKNMELIPEMNAYDKTYQILSKETIDGRHIWEMIRDFCKKDQLLLQEERTSEIVSYKNYTYMRKRWEKYLRQHKQKNPAWDSVMEIIEAFLPPVWKSVCKDEVFFGDWMPALNRFLD